MSNQNKPTLNLKPRQPAPVAPPPLAPVPAVTDTQPSPLAAAKNAPELAVKRAHAELLAKYPPPWVVGPHGDVWVAADVESFDPETEGGTEKVPGPNGTFWRATCAKPRLVFEPTDNGIAALTVDAINALFA